MSKNKAIYSVIEKYNLKPENTTKHQNKELEEQLLSLIIDSKESQEFALSVIKKEYFFYIENQAIFQLIGEIIEKKERHKFTDLVDILRDLKLDEYKHISSRVTPEYINSLYSTNLNTENLIPYIEELENLYIKRYFEAYFKEMSSTVKEKTFDVKTLITDLENLKSETREKSLQSKNFVEHGNVQMDVVIEVQEVIEGLNKHWGLTSSFKNIDDIVQGFRPGQLVILAARPGIGKTALALNMAAHIARNVQDKDKNNKVLFISLEMQKKELAKRVMSFTLNVDLKYLTNPKNIKKPREWKVPELVWSNNRNNEFKKLNENLLYDDDVTGNLNDIIWKIKNFKKDNEDLAFVVVDYLQLVSVTDISGNRQNEVSAISRSLKQLAIELNIPILALSQLSRNVESRENRRPQLHDLRESGSIEQDADIVIFLSRKESYDKLSKVSKDGEVQKNAQSIRTEKGAFVINTEVGIAKNRNGIIGTTNLAFYSNRVLFIDYNEYRPTNKFNKGRN
ncbi:replicative DNA helicase [Mycoplasmopsis synoviae]|uniref:replicative DNA helicase n=1 Tax=Mycoplasmopsis synoviae TaxID=2109 RepID=UPI0034DB3ADC